MRYFVIFTAISIVFMVSSCRGGLRVQEAASSESRLHMVFDNMYSLVLKPVPGSDVSKPATYQFVTCLGDPHSLDTSSCVTALSYGDGTAMDYGFVSKEDLSLGDMESIDRLKRELFSEYMQDAGDSRELISDISVVAMGGFFLGLPLVNARMKILLAQERILDAKLLFFKTYNKGFMKMPLQNRWNLLSQFDLPKNVSLLRIQAEAKWRDLFLKTGELLKEGRYTYDVLKEMENLQDGLNYLQQEKFPDLIQRFQKDMKDLTKRIGNQDFRGLAYKKHPRYIQVSQDAREIKALAKAGEYDQAKRLFVGMQDNWLLDQNDEVNLRRDIQPYKKHPKRLSILQKRFSTLRSQATSMLAEGKDTAALWDELWHVTEGLDDFRLSGQWSYENRWQVVYQLQEKSLRSSSRGAAALVANSKPSSAAVVSRGGKVISQRAGKLGGRQIPFLGWAVGLIAGASVIVAIVQGSSAKTFTDLSSVSVSHELSSSVPFVPVSVYKDYWPALSSVDPNANLEVPSVISVLKTLALHASFGDEHSAQKVILCVPETNVASQISSKCARVSQW